MGGIINELCSEITLPRMIPVRQLFAKDGIPEDKIAQAIRDELESSSLKDRLKPGMRIAITCGSRGISNIAQITASIAAFVKKAGAVPFVVPAMGSHGGASAEGQKALLEGYGVNEETIGCQIISSMETVVIGQCEIPGGETVNVRIDKNAAFADGIIVAGRVKPHTDFRGNYESGLMKMMAIGLGKREGADICHKLGFEYMPEMVRRFGKTILANTPVILGFAVIENARDETCKVKALSPEEIEEQEPALLEEARSRLPLIPFEKADVLVIDRIGKNISGNGMDPNITGPSPCSPWVKSNFSATRTVLLDLTEETHGSAFGMGAAHVITKRLFGKIDYDATYVNAVTSRGIDFVRIPAMADNDKEAVQLAIRTCTGHDPDNIRIIRIADSLSTKEFFISRALLGEAEKNPLLEILGESEDWHFDKEGNLL